VQGTCTKLIYEKKSKYPSHSHVSTYEVGRDIKECLQTFAIWPQYLENFTTWRGVGGGQFQLLGMLASLRIPKMREYDRV
jgi:hypothetical protein